MAVQDDDRICQHQERGRHIKLTCRNHPTLFWSTKNISHIGARSIFYGSVYDVDGVPECPCPASDLVVVCADCNPVPEEASK